MYLDNLRASVAIHSDATFWYGRSYHRRKPDNADAKRAIGCRRGFGEGGLKKVVEKERSKAIRAHFEIMSLAWHRQWRYRHVRRVGCLWKQGYDCKCSGNI